MKQTVTSCNYHTYKNYRIINPKSWKIRNNSMNVAAALNKPPPPPPSSHCWDTFSCYCNDERRTSPPTLFQKPKTCPNLPQITHYSNIAKPKSCNNIISDKNNSDNQNNGGNNDGDYSNNMAMESRLTFGEVPSELVVSDADNDNDDDESNGGGSDDDLMRQLSEFRNDHYFETHNTNLMMADKHVCQHQFRLDARCLAEPLNADEYGTSRCVICGQPMKNQFVDQSSLPPPTTITRTFYQYGLVPRQINLLRDGGNNDVSVEMLVGGGGADDDKNNGINGVRKMQMGSCYRRRVVGAPHIKLARKVKTTDNDNTFALRFQKSVVY